MTVTGQEIADYVDRVRAALADLPPAVRDELTEDLPEHLAEVAAEADGSLVDRLGEPEAYAAELRAAAGADAPAGNRRLAAARVRLGARLRALDTRLGPLLGYASTTDFLRLLRPAWWVLRGWLAALLVSAALGEPSGLLPRLGDSAVAGLFLLVGGVLASIWLGHRSERLRGWPRRLLRLGTAALVLFSFAMLVNVDQHASSEDFGYQEVSVGNPYDRVEDVFVYDSEGRLVENAQLFDQNGVPIRLGYPVCADPRQSSAYRSVRQGYPYCPELAPFQPRPPASTPAPPGVTASGSPTTAATPTATAAPAPTGAAPVPSPTR
ncbi:Uncharacterized membrane protein [Micromonospora rhizosphaerae]|uniref:Uncharacterized membrane protein n=1 Tax=Micromonospora rhizosphaerae TaxID=568872 RepID=A0A1C6RQ54_9ACTN|nr:hypothetical protein [Micromonospora rhizosphaerae]SCL19291.1 Uncharacterized membrane protein [Micromonospora rhizosphaerae]